jgi:hypothetical protein
MNFAMALGAKPAIQNPITPQYPNAREYNAAESRSNLSAQSNVPGRFSWGAAAVLLGGSSQSQPDGDGGGSDEDSDDDENSKRAGTRRKIRIEPIQDKQKRQITFSKRKNGILKKVPQYFSPGYWPDMN